MLSSGRQANERRPAPKRGPAPLVPASLSFVTILFYDSARSFGSDNGK
jgi:hypothetical protein